MRSSDRFFLTQLVPGGLDLVAVYALAEKLSLPIGLAAAALNLAYPAHGIRTEQDPSSARDVFRYFMTGSVFVGFLCVITSPWLIRLLATPSYAASADYVPYLTTYLTLNGLVVIPSLYLTRKGLARVVLVITFSAGALNLALNALLIPAFGIHGAAASTVMTYAFYCGWAFREASVSGLVADSRAGWLLLACFLVGGVAGVNEPVALLAVGIGLVVIVVAGGLLDRRDLLRVRSSLARLFPRLKA
jgi:O-antigen/teichoic acid export membrane protein